MMPLSTFGYRVNVSRHKFLRVAPTIFARTLNTSTSQDAPTASHDTEGKGVVSYGGLSREGFVMMVERGAPFIGAIMRAKVKDISYHQFSMILPKNEKLIGNIRTPCYHGGAVATMIDHVAGFCAWSALRDPYQRVSTVSLNVDYLLPPPVEDLIFDARIEHLTSRLARVSCTVWDSQHRKKVALGRGLFNIYKGNEDLSVLIAMAVQQEQQMMSKVNAANPTSPTSTK